MKFIIIFIAAILIVQVCSVKQDKIRRPLSGDNIGTNLYQTQVVSQTMKRPQKWFFNVMVQKPNEKYFKEAEYNGLRYQTEMLQDSIEREYNHYVRDYYDEKLNVQEMKLINAVKLHKQLMSKSK